MKKVNLLPGLVLATFILFSCSPLMGQTKANKIRNDLSEKNLKGKVKSITQIKFDAGGTSGEVRKVKTNGKGIMLYNEQGNMTEETYYNSDGSLYSTYLYKFNDKCNKIEQNRYKIIGGSLDSKTVYTYDIKGNNTEEKMYQSDGSLQNRCVYKYDLKGNRIERLFYRSDGSLSWKDVYKLDAKGNRVGLDNYTAEGLLQNKYLSTFDEKGNEIESSIYKADGSRQSKFTYEFDEQGNQVLMSSYLQNGSLFRNYSRKYDYDASGNWIRETSFEDDVPTAITEREISYYPVTQTPVPAGKQGAAASAVKKGTGTSSSKLLTGTFTDARDGKTYKTVKIGTQTWMAENLSFKTDFGCWAYNNDPNNAAIYGYLYNWEATKSISPEGWHVPSDAEWKTLVTYLGGDTLATNKMKETGLAHWESPNANSTNSSGFSAIPAGYVRSTSEGGLKYEGIGIIDYWWTSTESYTDAFCRDIYSGYNAVTRGAHDKAWCFSVRCVQNKVPGKVAGTVPGPQNGTKSNNPAVNASKDVKAVAIDPIYDSRDGQNYKTVKIGTQTWMAENLAFKTSSGCWAYDNNPINLIANGYLYNWETAKNACPSGWHLPNDAEWKILENYAIAKGYNYDGTKSENKIAKAMAATTSWRSISSGDGPGSADYPAKRNVTGFSALASGIRNNGDGIYGLIGEYGFWWSATENDAKSAACRRINYSWVHMLRDISNKEAGFSVRCLKD